MQSILIFSFRIRVLFFITNIKLILILKNNKAKAIRFSTLEAICKELNCQPGDILEYKEDQKGNEKEDELN
ncbi:helix-turn-helix domain-containing protein [Clostridium botulinum]|uniref:helix-turn-helix domain-containing protein n=1 Tax=Clostridium botulinum TaxID=1491 RepID=UPI001FAE266B|nr:helix-turn-helix domain-containing protein [Clostridium botulinum]